MKIISYNVNGIRAAMKKDLIKWLKAVNPDVICFQEIKANEEQIDVGSFEDLGYHHFWFSAQKKGYSGVAILSKQKPSHVEFGCGIETSDAEGRVIRADFDVFSIISVYMPSGSNIDRIGFKHDWNESFLNYIAKLKLTIPNLIISGDFNICHHAIDIHNPVANKNTSGFLPSERAWLDRFFELGFVDSFRHFNQEPDNYTWWSYMARARPKNLGWRLDYHAVSSSLTDKMKRSVILKDAVHSDHCPILLQLSF